VLFRVDLDRASGGAAALVQSDKPPDWFALPAGYLREVQAKAFDPAFAAGQRLAFRLRANPTKKIGTTSKADRLAGKHKDHGQRVGLCREEEQVTWLRCKGGAGGFRVHAVTAAPEGLARGRKQAGEVGLCLTLYGVRFDGLLEVTDPERFLQTVRDGVGPAKGFGFGLLSLARPEG
jgi:CRISPR system Cascade subunit CasE